MRLKREQKLKLAKEHINDMNSRNHYLLHEERLNKIAVYSIPTIF